MQQCKYQDGAFKWCFTYVKNDMKLKVTKINMQYSNSSYSRNKHNTTIITTYLVLAISTGIEAAVVIRPLIILDAKWHIILSLK